MTARHRLRRPGRGTAGRAQSSDVVWNQFALSPSNFERVLKRLRRNLEAAFTQFWSSFWSSCKAVLEQFRSSFWSSFEAVLERFRSSFRCRAAEGSAGTLASRSHAVARRFGRWAHAGGRPATGSKRAENCKNQLLKKLLKTARKLLKKTAPETASNYPKLMSSSFVSVLKQFFKAVFEAIV